MELLKNKNINLRIIAIVLTFFIAVSPFANIRKVKAELVLSGIAVASVVGIILAALASQGDISGDYTVTAPQLDAIQQTAQGLLLAGGAGAIDQANKLGEAIKSGAESAKIKALASGAVIYAFLQAIQEVLWSTDYTQVSIPSGETFLAGFGDIAVYSSVKSGFEATPVSGYNYFLEVGSQYDIYFTDPAMHGAQPGIYTWGNFNDGCRRLRVWNISTKTVLTSSNVFTDKAKFPCGYHVFIDRAGDGVYIGAALGIPASLAAIGSGAVYDPSINKVSEKESVTVPTVLPQTIINNINNWDGTSDLVLAPPLPYDIPTGEDLVIDPSYTGSEVEDPDTPDVPDKPEEGTIVLPWLAALLGLLGLGNPSLEGIDAGVKTAIDKLIEGITATAQDVFDGSKEIFGNITDALTGIDAGIQSGIDALTGSISVPLANIADFALSVPDFFAIPEGKSIATPIIEQIPTVFPIVDQMNTALNKITVETRPLIIYYPYLDGSTKEINLNWYEPAREQVKHGVGLLFKVVTALACFAMVSNVFGIGIRVGAGQAYTDNNSGGGNSRKKDD